MAAMISVEEHGGACAVGDERVVAPVGEQVGLVTGEAGTTHNEAFLVVLCFSDVGFTVFGVPDRDPLVVADSVDKACHGSVLGYRDRKLDVLGLERVDRFL
jgi:hypothetical protein